VNGEAEASRGLKPALRIRFKKKNDGSAVITAIRADGSSTHHSIGSAGGYGPVHDFCHYAVETYFDIQRGFYGLLAEGWNIDDFETGVRGPIPDEAAFAERLAGALSQSLGGAQRFTADDVNLTVGSAAVTEEQLPQIEKQVFELCARWRALEHGETLELTYDARSVGSGAGTA
jgi:hypothetical protein